MHPLHTAVAALTLTATAGVQAAPKDCLAPAEAEALVIVLLPNLATAIGQRCTATLPANATLRGGLAPLVARWRADAAGSAALAATAVGKLGGGGTEAADNAEALAMMSGSLTADVARSINPKTCVDVDRIVANLAPLPTRNLAGLFVSVFRAAGKGGITVCEAARP